MVARVPRILVHRYCASTGIHLAANDHTYGSRVGKPTPASYVATNDYAVGLMVQASSHSKIRGSSQSIVQSLRLTV
jgi:hypothetical protein